MSSRVAMPKELAVTGPYKPVTAFHSEAVQFPFVKLKISALVTLFVTESAIVCAVSVFHFSQTLETKQTRSAGIHPCQWIKLLKINSLAQVNKIVSNYNYLRSIREVFLYSVEFAQQLFFLFHYTPSISRDRKHCLVNKSHPKMLRRFLSYNSPVIHWKEFIRNLVYWHYYTTPNSTSNEVVQEEGCLRQIITK